MNAIYTADYMASLTYVNSNYESDAETLNKLNSLYCGRDELASKVLSLGGNAAELLTARLDAELDQLLLESSADESKVITVPPTVSNEDLEQILQVMHQRYADNAKLAQAWEAEIYSNIHSYDFEAMGIEIKPVIDFIVLQFEANKPTTYQQIKKHLTEKTGVGYYVEPDHNGLEQQSNTFTIRVHNVKSKKGLNAVIKPLEHYGVKQTDIKVARIEASLDFYNAKSKGLLTALYKSLAYVKDSTNQRVYKKQGEFQTIPTSPIHLLEKLEDGYCIGVNPKDSPVYYRSYYKTTDRRLNLNKSEYRVRTEVNCAVSELGVDNGLGNLPEIIQCAFNHLKFTKQSNKATEQDKKLYMESVGTFGKRNDAHYSNSRHKRTLDELLIKHAELNSLLSKCVSNLKRNFK
ncbi:MAG: hypothetical protein L0G51_04325 [Lactococcus lactis]|jgi:hypothetical protein|nr:hypothetical protein [Lactococcus lactis]